MRTPFLAILLVPLAAWLGQACMPFSMAGEAADGAGGGPVGSGGFGGGTGATIKTNTSTTSSGSGGSGTGAASPHSYAYLCGGSAATCTPGPESTECALGGNPNMGGGSSTAGSKLACQLVVDGNTVAAKCGYAGGADDGDPCEQASDCRAGLGCGSTAVTGVCREYCCGDPEKCPSNTFCARTVMAESAKEVPLCVPAKPCELLNDAAYCQAGETCTIVRADGTTSCVPIPDAADAGLEGEGCPCAAGLVCSSGTCLKLCHVGSDDCGDDAICQGGYKPYPSDIGFCVSL